MHRSKKYWLSAALFMLCGAWLLKAQDTLDFAKVESRSYGLYEQKQWPQLGSFCKLAIKSGFDYYYLRIRAGIALYELKQYRLASEQFKKALAFNAGDNLALEYLYYCYLYNEREEAARRLSKSFTPEFATYMHTAKLSPFAYITADGGAKLSDSANKFKPATFGQLGLTHYLGRSISLFHTASYYAQSEYRFSVTQWQYYLRATFPLKRELSLSAGAHVLYGDATGTTVAVSEFTVQDAQKPGSGPSPVRTATRVEIRQVRTQIMMAVGALSLTKHLPSADLSVGAAAFFSDTASQLQVSAGAAWFPFKNNTFSIGGSAIVHGENSFDRFHLALAPSLNARVYKGLYLGLAYFTNQGPNITEQTGYLINNSLDYTLQRITLSPSYVFSHRLSVYATAGIEEKRTIDHTFNYHYAIFLIGLRINPFKNHT